VLHLPEAPAELDLSADIRAFFGETLQTVLAEVSVAPTEAAKAYLVALMADFADPARAPGTSFDEPLTLSLERALEARAPERFDRLRQFGDAVLYVSSFFAENLARRGVPLGYVSALGSRAYRSAAQSLGVLGKGELLRDDGGSDTLFVELGDKFQGFVGLLEKVAERLLASGHPSHKSTLEVYERWLRSGSGVLASTLIERGLLPQRGNGAVH
jgi:hypothetical protein